MSPRNQAVTAKHINAVIAESHTRSRHLLHILHALQQRFLHIPPEAVIQVASFTGLPISQVQSVVEFYAFFSTSPRGKYDILLSNCTSCGYQTGGENLLHLLCDRLHVIPGKTRADGMVSVGETSCIGMCDHGAAMLINGMPVPRLEPGKIMRIADLIETETPLDGWPAEWLCIDDNIRKGGMLLSKDFVAGEGLRASLALGTNATLAEITQSGLRGRGGAGFSAGMKWKFCREAQEDKRYVVCNADEGEPGTFKDRILLHNHADAVFEGMTVCAHVIGAEKGFLYLRGEYRYLLPQLQEVLAKRRALGLLGDAILTRSGFDFDIEIVVGAGAYICGEESALIESLEHTKSTWNLRSFNPFLSSRYRYHPAKPPLFV